MPEYVLRELRREVVCLEVDAAASQEEGDIDGSGAGVAWAVYRRRVFTRRVRRCVLCENSSEDGIADFWWDEAIVERGRCLWIRGDGASMEWEKPKCG
jgi:hypothetical protein